MSKQKETDEQIVSRTCRGCYGWGDGLCAYHAHRFRRLEKRLKKQSLLAIIKHVYAEAEK